MLVALGIGGGIAAYKACEIVRGLDKAGLEVQVLMTESATEFVTPLTLQTLSRHRVLVGTFDRDEEQTIRHIELTRKISALVVAQKEVAAGLIGVIDPDADLPDDEAEEE